MTHDELATLRAICRNAAPGAVVTMLPADLVRHLIEERDRLENERDVLQNSELELAAAWDDLDARIDTLILEGNSLRADRDSHQREAIRAIEERDRLAEELRSALVRLSDQADGYRDV